MPNWCSKGLFSFPRCLRFSFLETAPDCIVNRCNCVAVSNNFSQSGPYSPNLSFHISASDLPGVNTSRIWPRPSRSKDADMVPSVSTSVLSLVLLLAPQLASATCYWQNSTLAPDDPYSIAPDDTACFPDQDNSPCCGTGWTCLSDGVCFIREDETDFYYRGTCTDRTWDSQQCPGWCFAQSKSRLR